MSRRRGRSVFEEAGRELVDEARERARSEAMALRRELERPWREGPSGTAAETGRWIGMSLAIGAVAAGVALGIYAGWPRR